MASSILNSDDGVISGVAGIKATGGDDGVLVFQSKGTETARINTDSQIVAAAGTASLPVLTTTGDLNTGIYFPAADNIGFATGGTIRGRWTTDGLCFGSDTAAANALDDYEEGTWTPTIGGSGSDPSVTYGGRDGRYIKIGSLVWCYWLLETSARTGGTGSCQIKGLPFTPVNDEFPGGMTGSYGFITQSANSTGLSPRVQSNTNNMFLFEQTSTNRTQSFLAVTGWGANGFMYGSVIYRT
jgi:hypothetical protein